MTTAFSFTDTRLAQFAKGRPPARSISRPGTPIDASVDSVSPWRRRSPFAHLRHDLLVGLGALLVLVGVISLAVFGEPQGVASASSADRPAIDVTVSTPDQASAEAAVASVAIMVEQQRLEAADAYLAARAQQAADRAAADSAAAARAPARPAAVAATTGRTAPAAADGSVWDRLAQCESGGNWSINTGNGFTGGLQFVRSTWLGMGGAQYAPDAYLATREQQIDIATRVLASQGWGAWPGCSSMLGLR